MDENSTKSQNYPPKMINLSPKFIISPKMLTYAFFSLSNRRESLVRAFRKKTPLSVRRPWGVDRLPKGTSAVGVLFA